ncbi:MAG: gliding motility-associated C-terminal domain-containing protein [Flavobacteriales bacterium]|nr:gliding motility-associated C-terminal domain-containing protein [Flavobacteriales bacterium]
MKFKPIFLIIVLVSLSNFYAHCQHAGEDITICEGSSTQLNANSELTKISWLPAEYLSNPNIHNPIVSGLTTTTDFIITANSKNLIINGDFELGNTSFNTDYTYSNNSGQFGVLSNESSFTITNDASLAHNNFDGNDHTNPPNGKFMVINGSEVINTKVWCQTVNTEQNTEYEFSTWVTSVFANNPAILEFSINNEPLGDSFTAPDEINTWDNYYEVWHSGINTSAELCIVNLNSQGAGNDFGIDDISFNIYEMKDTVRVFVKEREQFSHEIDLCEDENSMKTSLYNINNLNSYSTLQSNEEIKWFQESTLTNPINDSTIIATENTKLYGITSDLECKLAIINFKIYDKPKIEILSDNRICAGQSYNFSNTSINFNTNDNIKFLSFSNIYGQLLSTTNFYPKSDLNVIIECETEYGCQDLENFKIFVYNIKAQFLMDRDKIYVNEEVKFENNSLNSDNLFWDFGNEKTGTEQTHTITYDTTGLYEVKLKIKNSENCVDSVSKYILVRPYINLYIPSCFSPNEDGKNDIFEIYGDGLLEYDLSIFNRWGEKIYQNRNVGWNGKYKNKMSPNGVYCYKVKITDFEYKSHYFYGDFSLIR